jgi:hypothetical protein
MFGAVQRPSKYSRLMLMTDIALETPLILTTGRGKGDNG